MINARSVFRRHACPTPTTASTGNTSPPHSPTGTPRRARTRRTRSPSWRPASCGSFTPAANDPIVTPLKNLLGVDEKAHCAQRLVDWFLDGRRNSPPYEYRGVIGPPMAKLYRDETAGAAATDVEMDVLVNALAGGERDLFVAVIPAERLVLARTLVDDLIFGAN